MSIVKNLEKILNELEGTSTKLIAVSKTKPVNDILEAYDTGFKRFGENKVQELSDKFNQMPKDIEWHMIGHLQRNKVKYIAPFVSLIHGVDSFKLLKEINKQALSANRVIDCLLQIHIAQESTKFGLSFDECTSLLEGEELKELHNVKIKGLMGMATFTPDESLIRKEFRSLKTHYDQIKSISTTNVAIQELSMGMSGDYHIAIEEGSTLIRVGSSIFGERNYH